MVNKLRTTCWQGENCHSGHVKLAPKFVPPLNSTQGINSCTFDQIMIQSWIDSSPNHWIQSQILSSCTTHNLWILVPQTTPWQWQLYKGIKAIIPKENCKGVGYEVSCKYGIGQYVAKTLEKWRSACRSICDTLRMAELTHQPLLSMQLWRTMISTEPLIVIGSAANTGSRKVTEALHIACKHTTHEQGF